MKPRKLHPRFRLALRLERATERWWDALDRLSAALDTPDGLPRDLYWGGIRILRIVDEWGAEIAPDHYTSTERRFGKLDGPHPLPDDDDDDEESGGSP